MIVICVCAPSATRAPWTTGATVWAILILRGRNLHTATAIPDVALCSTARAERMLLPEPSKAKQTASEGGRYWGACRSAHER